MNPPNADEAAAVPSCFQTGTMSTTCVRVPKISLGGAKCAKPSASAAATDDDDDEDEVDEQEEDYEEDNAEAGDGEDDDDDQGEFGGNDLPSAYNNPQLAHVVGAPNLVTRKLVIPLETTVGDLRKGVIVELDEEFMKSLLQQKAYRGNGRRGNVKRMFVVNVTQGAFSKDVSVPVFMTLLDVCKPRTRTLVNGKFQRVSAVLSSYAGEKDIMIAGRRKLSSLSVVQSQLGVDHEKLKTQYQVRVTPGESTPSTAWVHESTELFGLASDNAEHYGVTADFGEDQTLDKRGHYVLPVKLIEKIIEDTAEANSLYKPDNLSKFRCKYQINASSQLDDSAPVNITQELSIAALWADPADYRVPRS